MTVSHKDLTGVDLHEPKGIGTAIADQIYRADGAGSGSWQTLSLPTGTHRVALTSFTSSGTWTKPANLMKVRVHVTSSGGSGGVEGGLASFGAHCTATSTSGGAAVAGGGTGGDINLTGSTYDATDRPTAYAPGPYGTTKGKGGSVSASGGYTTKEILAASLGATETVTIGATGANNGFVVVEETITT